VHDLEQALSVIKHAPSPEVVHGVVQKLDVDGDGFVVLEHVLDLIGEEGLGEFISLPCYPLTSFHLGIVMDDEAQTLIGQGREIKAAKPRKEDIVQE
jgi:LETM1 and EF-hand domain-containing protein 1, mitochondrial